MASKKAKNAGWQDGACVTCRRRKVLLECPFEPCQRSYFFDLKTTDTVVTSFHDFFHPKYSLVCGGTSQKHSMVFF
jgi:hypothetical protein